MKGTRWRKIVKKLINTYHGEICLDVMRLIWIYATHSKWNEKIYRKKIPMQIPLDVIEFDRIIFSNMKCLCRQGSIPTFFDKDMIIINGWSARSQCTKELWIPCIRCNEHTPINLHFDNIEYDGVIIFHLYVHDKFAYEHTILLKMIII